MKIDIELTEEQTAALQWELDTRNASNGTAVSIAERLEEIILTECLAAVGRHKDAGAAIAAEEFKKQPFAERRDALEAISAKRAESLTK